MSNVHGALAVMAGPRGALRGAARGEPVVRRAPSGEIMVTVNERPSYWSGEWPGDVMIMFLTPVQAATLGGTLIAFAEREYAEKMMPGQEPYTEAEREQRDRLVAEAAEGDPGEANEADHLRTEGG